LAFWHARAQAKELAMPSVTDRPLRTLDDVVRFESAMPLEARLPGPSVFDVFVASAARHPERTAITMVMSGAPDEDPRRVPYGELVRLVRRAANLFSSLGGVRPGVAYMLPSLVETHATLWGAETAGYAVPINFLLQPAHIKQLLRASGARILVALGPHPQLDIWQKALALREELPELTLIRVAPPDTPAESGVLDFGAALMDQPDDRLVFGAPGRGDDVAAYFHTGGTTGAPRLVAHSHRGQLAAALGGAALTNLSEEDVLTANLPLFHVGGTIFCALSLFLTGAHVIVMSPSGMRNQAMVAGFWRIAERHGATLVGGVPTSVGAVLEVPLGTADLRKVRAGFCGAASLPAAVGERFRQALGKNLHEIYGMTEASGIISVDPPMGSEGGAGSVGFRLPYTQLVVRRLNSDGSLGDACASDEIGVVTVRGPTVSPGYRDPAHNRGVIEDGTLNTGDLGYVDESGRLHIAGRSKDLIVRSGHNIDPVMIENAMATHPAVALSAAVGMPDAYAGELPVCYVALRPGATVTEDELHVHARSTIAERPAWPKHIHLVDTIPLTSVGKIYKPQLRCDAAERLVTLVVREGQGLPEARVQVREGGRRGMTVRVTLPDALRSSFARVQEALKAYLFEVEIEVQ
jgi:fatty-acyl-CoA synthase